MTDHVARAIEREFAAYLDPCDLYDLKAKVEQFLRPTRDRVSAQRFKPSNDDPCLTPDEKARLDKLAGGRATWFGERFS